jgi:RNA chaperone Hfq
METNLLDKMLADYRSRRTPVTIVLQNKARVTGRIETFDSYVIIMENSKQEIVYRHAIASVLPYIEEASAPVGERRAAPAKTAPKTAPHPRPQPKKEQRPARPAPKPAAAPPAESGLNTGMKEGLLRWMQEQKAGK